MGVLKDIGITFIRQIELCVPEGREASIAKTKIEEAVMWAVKGLTSDEDDMPKGAEKVTKNLDMLVQLDQPESFVREAIKAIEANSSDRWKPVLTTLQTLETALAAANEPKAKTHDRSEPQP